jgi:signal transduction histidine kinase
VTIIGNAAVLTFGAITEPEDIRRVGWGIFAWIAIEAAVGLATVAFASGSQLGLDAPLLLAAGFIFGPTLAGLIGFFGYVDVREFRREVPLKRALFNRSQISLSVAAAAVVFQLLPFAVGDWPIVALAALCAVAVDILVNWGLVSAVRALHDKSRIREVLGGLIFGHPTEFLVTYAAFALLGAVLADVYDEAGPWSLLIFILPIVLARQAFLAAGSLDTAARRLRAKDAALVQASRREWDERRDERLAIAAGLHDEVLPPMFKIHLMGQVVKNDMASGRLLALEQDVPQLVDATLEANDAVRRLIGGLRASSLGAAGLGGTIRMLCDELGSYSETRIIADIEEVDASPAVQLLTYQVAREALRNAVRHASATRIDVQVRSDSSAVRLVVSDDGTGFTPRLVDHDHHFGLQLIRERVELYGGSLVTDSRPGSGTTIVARIPAWPDSN